MPVQVQCEECGKICSKSLSQYKRSKHHFCSIQCHMKNMNREMNPFRMTPEVREKLREVHLGKGDSKTYEKTYGKHTHRAVAEEILGRSLLPGEVVHHIDGDIRNNDPSNLMIFPSQSEHVKWHWSHDWR